MTTRDQWQAMTEQQQWDYVRLLEDTVDTLELDGAENERGMFERSIKDAPTDEQHS